MSPDALAGTPNQLEYLRRSERTMLVVRAFAVPWTVLQVVAYRNPYPPGIRLAALAVVAAFALGELAVWAAHRRTCTVPQARALAMVALGLDIAVASAFVWLFAFDENLEVWAPLLLLPLEGATRFQLRGALTTWGAVAVLYTAREAWGTSRYGYTFLWESVRMRMGIALLIALVAGMMARDLTRQRARLADSLRELRRVDSLRSGLVSTLAHDVRSPLAVIRGVLRLLVEQEGALSPEQVQDLLRRADRQAGKLEALAGDLLDLARLERGRLELSFRDVRLSEAVAVSLALLEESDAIDVRIDPAVVVRADPARLDQILFNLAANALRHGAPPVVVEATLAGDRAEVTFRDHGAGVPPDQRAHLFEPFGGRQEHGSVGFGLALAKLLAEAHGGELSYEDNAPHGACFRLTLADARAEPEPGVAGPPPVPDAGRSAAAARG